MSPIPAAGYHSSEACGKAFSRDTSTEAKAGGVFKKVCSHSAHDMDIEQDPPHPASRRRAAIYCKDEVCFD
jgi:hypothetical protein